MNELNFTRLTGFANKTLDAIRAANPGRTVRFVGSGKAYALLQQGWSYAETAGQQTVYLGKGKASEQVLLLSPAPLPEAELAQAAETVEDQVRSEEGKGKKGKKE